MSKRIREIKKSGEYILELLESLQVAANRVREGSTVEMNYLLEKSDKLQKAIDWYIEEVQKEEKK